MEELEALDQQAFERNNKKKEYHPGIRMWGCVFALALIVMILGGTLFFIYLIEALAK